MNKEIFEGHWNEFKGTLKEKWGKLTDDDLKQIDGKWDKLLGSLEKKYGYKKDEAENELSNWKEGLKKWGEKHGL